MKHNSNLTRNKPSDQYHAIGAGFTNFALVCETLYFKAQNITEPNTLKCVYSDSVVY